MALALLTLNSTIPVLSANAAGEISTYSMDVTYAYTVDSAHALKRTSIIGSSSATIRCSLGPGNGYYIYANLHKDPHSTDDYYAATETALFSSAGTSERVSFQKIYTASNGPYYMRAKILHMSHTTAGEYKSFQYGYSY